MTSVVRGRRQDRPVDQLSDAALVARARQLFAVGGSGPEAAGNGSEAGNGGMAGGSGPGATGPRAPGSVLDEIWTALHERLPDAAGEVLAGWLDEGRRSGVPEILAADLVSIPAAAFTMGSDPHAAYVYWGEEPAHRVRLAAYRLGRHPVTNEIFRHYAPHHDPLADPRLPVVNVTWHDARMFCRWAGVRLPTEAEWEYACAASGEIDERQLGRHAWYSDTSGGLLHPVGGLAPTAFGLHDMLGNAWEWCADTFAADYYSRSPVTDPCNVEDGPDRVCRGGSMHGFYEMCRARFRHHEPAGYWAYDLGFRVAADADLNAETAKDL